MDWARYKALCDQPDYWSRWMLEQCVELFQQLDEPDLSLALQQVLHTQPLAMPDDHHGHPTTEMFQLRLSPSQYKAAVAAVSAAVAKGLTTSGTSSRGLGGFLEAWREYADRQA